MTRSCVICGCKDNRSRPPGVSFHCLPRDPQLCTQWLMVLNLPANTDCAKVRICSKHFNKEDYDNCFSAQLFGNAGTRSSKKLKPGALPRIAMAMEEHQEPITSTPKAPRTQQRPRGPGAQGSRGPALHLQDTLDTSFSSIATLEATQSTYQPDTDTDTDTDCSSSTTSETDGTTEMSWQEKKVVVAESNILDLFRFCQTCGSPIEERAVSYLGSQMRVKWECAQGCGGTWTSCPSERGMPQYNLLMAAALLFTGSTYTHLEEWAKLLNLQIFSSKTYYAIQNTYLHPAIQAEYHQQQTALMAKLYMEQEDGKELHLCSDGRSDSPGFNAKFTTYTFMADPGREIIHSELVQVTETTSSGAMETVALRRGLDHLLDSGLQVEVLATDRSTSVKKIMREEYPEVDHQFDIWHAAKNIQNKLIVKSKRRGCGALKPWIRSVRNHLWFSSGKAEGKVTKLRSTWNSILNHVLDEHTWTEGGTQHGCLHPPLTEEDREKRQWLEKDSEAYKQLAEVINEKTFQRDLDHMGRFKHTGALEVFHSALLKYAPKRQCFSYQSMKQRINMAILHHNENVDKKPKLDSEGNPVIIQEWSKRSKEWVTRHRYIHTTNFRLRLIQLVLDRRNDHSISYNDESSSLTNPDLPSNIGTLPRPAKEDAVLKHKSRFGK